MTKLEVKTKIQKTQNMTKFKWCQNSRTQIVTISKTQNMTKLKKQLWQNWKVEISQFMKTTKTLKRSFSKSILTSLQLMTCSLAIVLWFSQSLRFVGQFCPPLARTGLGQSVFKPKIFSRQKRLPDEPESIASCAWVC